MCKKMQWLYTNDHKTAEMTDMSENTLKAGATGIRWFCKEHTSIAAMLSVFCGGTIGSLLRITLGFLQSTSPGAWPWATTIVNLVGAFMLGVITEWFALTGEDSGGRKVARLGLGTGLIGGFTTYGTMIIEMNTRLFTHHIMLAIGYSAVSIVVGLLCASLGIVVGTVWAHHSGNRLTKVTAFNTDSDAHAKASFVQATRQEHGDAELQITAARGGAERSTVQVRCAKGPQDVKDNTDGGSEEV